jgi:hypothetical protein
MTTNAVIGIDEDDPYDGPDDINYDYADYDELVHATGIICLNNDEIDEQENIVGCAHKHVQEAK